MFLLVIATAYLEAQGIWEPFKRRLSVESNSPMETGKPFDLREIVRIQSDAKWVSFFYFYLMSLIYKEVIIHIWFTFYVRCFTKCIWSVAAWMILPTQTRTQQEECTGQALAGGLGVGRVVCTPVPTATVFCQTTSPDLVQAALDLCNPPPAFRLIKIVAKDSASWLIERPGVPNSSSRAQASRRTSRAQDPHSQTAQGPTVQKNRITTDSWQPWIKTSTGLSLLPLTCLQNTIHNSLHKTKVIYNNILA